MDRRDLKFNLPFEREEHILDQQYGQALLRLFSLDLELVDSRIFVPAPSFPGDTLERLQEADLITLAPKKKHK